MVECSDARLLPPLKNIKISTSPSRKLKSPITTVRMLTCPQPLRSHPKLATQTIHSQRGSVVPTLSAMVCGRSPWKRAAAGIDSTPAPRHSSQHHTNTMLTLTSR